ncbi:hypothetical protein Salat_2068800 [Sesamum alatum]|uniref:Uncharacterized protein n=1 Tax=Sesamum alatum TaxID=300844 RepID=A0AAE1Y189_9LAMI|nr:hypothetical protein Salat_2068800 [Sesamum alatum]
MRKINRKMVKKLCAVTVTSILDRRRISERSHHRMRGGRVCCVPSAVSHSVGSDKNQLWKADARGFQFRHRAKAKSKPEERKRDDGSAGADVCTSARRRKDRHSKVCTARGRGTGGIRLSPKTCD